MEIENKLNRIQELDILKLAEIVVSLAKKMNFKSARKIESVENLVVCELDNIISNQIHGFIIQTNKSTAKDFAEIVEEIKKNIKAYNLNYVYYVTTSHISNNLKIKIKSDIVNIEFIEREKLIKIIDEFDPNIWRHSDTYLIKYEQNYSAILMEDSELKRLKIFNDRYQKLVGIFIEPNIFHFYEKPDTNVVVRDRITINRIVNDEKSCFISGEAGSGKSTLLKQIGKEFIDLNTKSRIRKYIPIFVQINDLFNFNYKLEEYLEKISNEHFLIDFNKLSETYHVVVMIDSIDELEDKDKKTILTYLEEKKKNNNIIYIVASRNADKLSNLLRSSSTNKYYIHRFNSAQIKRFVSLFFQDQKNLSDQLLEALRENRTIEKLPITPLTLSLISILYEENNLEIPATVTDIYNNFNHLLIGRSSVASGIEFIDIAFKERMLSIYALELLKKKDHSPLTIDELKEFFSNYFKNKTIPIRGGDIKKAVDYLIHHTGLLLIRNDNYVTFSHDSFMEYYASVEMFKHQREYENQLIDNFFDPHWQNTAIFYAGASKDMPDFLFKINQKVKSASKHAELLMGIIGSGFILQALYQTDNNLRKEGIIESLNLSIRNYETLVKLSADEMVLMKNFRIPILLAMTFTYYFECFHSVTLKQPLYDTFNEIFDRYELDGDKTFGFKALNLAFILASNKLNNQEPLERMIFGKQLSKDPVLLSFADFVIDNLQGTTFPQFTNFRRELKKDIRKLSPSVNLLHNESTSKLRFSPLHTIHSNKKIKIITEGKTDAEIIEHAFITLTNGELPYWHIRPVDDSAGGATEVYKFLSSSKAVMEENDIFIGLFDRDEKGLSEFERLNKKFIDIIPKCLKKHSDCEIYALCLPVPEHRNVYIHKEHKFNFLQIEHYFEDEYLKSKDMVKASILQDILEIIDSKKTKFSIIVRSEISANIFKHFVDLFKVIDNISNKEIIYEY